MPHASSTKAMGLLRQFRSKNKPRSGDDSDAYEPLASPGLETPPAANVQSTYFAQPTSQPPSRDHTARLAPALLQRICSFICPHAVDRSHVSSENSAAGDGCMLCDMRDLARAAQVNRRWYKAAQSLLYSSVRIDAVHYCELEGLLSQKRQRRTLRHPVGEEQEDTPARRLSLFCRTVRESPDLAQQVEILKLPYMTRETSKGGLAATVSVLANLQYVDLPEGVFDGDASCHTLVNELQTRCPNISRMAYRKGAESYLESLTNGHWSGLRELELSGVAVEPGLLRVILGSLPALDKLAMLEVPWLTDSLFEQSSDLPAFPAVSSLTVEECPRITSLGFRHLLSQQRNRRQLTSLQLRRTGVTIASLNEFLYDATHLEQLTITARVNFSDTLAISTSPLLASVSLRTLSFLVTDADGHAPNLSRPSSAFYTYLARSIHSNSLPTLTTLYARDPSLADLLSMPMPGSSSLASPLELYTKSTDESDWTHTHIEPSDPNPNPFADTSPAFTSRPVSAYAASRVPAPTWPSITTNGLLSVPHEVRPRSADSDAPSAFAGPKRKDSDALWPPSAPGYARSRSFGAQDGLPPPWVGKEQEEVVEVKTGRLSGLMAKVGVQRGKKGGAKYDLWR